MKKLIIILLILALAINLCGCSSKDYKQGVDLMNSGLYTDAITVFESLDGYKDSAELILECKYNNALVLMDNGNYDGAIAVFNEIIDYKDSAELMHQCYGTIDTISESTPILMPKQLTMDDVITLPDDIEVTFDSVIFSTEINERRSSHSTLSVAETINNDNTICGLRFIVKNISSEPYNTTLISDTLERGFYVDFDYSPTLIYADKYEFTGSRHNTSSYDINPLTSGVCYFTFEVPNYFETSGDSISIVFTINDVPYEVLIREQSAESAESISRELIINETYISEGHGEITLKSVNTADSLYPSSTNGYYTYYSAEEGQVFIIAEFDVKYLGNEDTTAKRLLGGYAIFDGNKYTCQCIPESSMDGIGSANIEFNPLAEDTIYLIFSIPENAVPRSISYELNLSGFSLEITDYTID